MNYLLMQKILGLLLVVILPILSFQNCGKPGFHADLSGSVPGKVAQESLSEGPTILDLRTADSDLQPGMPFRIFADLTGFPMGSLTFWDSDFTPGSTYCLETTSLDGTTTDFECPSPGVMTAKLTILTPEGGSHFFSMQIGIGGVVPTPTVPEATPTPTPAPNATPTPSATPVMLSQGAQLYNMKCSGCHGTLPGSSNKMNRSLTDLNNALMKVGAMQSISLTADQKTMIINALNGIN